MNEQTMALLHKQQQSPPPSSMVFQSKAAYHPAIILLILFAPTICIALIIFDYMADAVDLLSEIYRLAWTVVALVIVFALVLPRRFEVWSDQSIRIVTVLPAFTWTFHHVTEAHRIGMLDEWSRPKIKFAVSLATRVAVRRHGPGCAGTWDVLVSPKDPDGFVAAVASVAESGEGSSYHGRD